MQINRPERFDPSVVAVAIPTYRRQELLLRLISTIPEGIPIAISDNGASLDRSVLPARPFLTVVVSDPPTGMFANWNRSVRAVQGSEFVINPSDDDLFRPDAFDKISAAVKANPEVDVFIFGHEIVDGKDSVMSRWVPVGEMIELAPVGFVRFSSGVDARMPSICFRRSLFERLGGYHEGYGLTAGDSDLIHRLLLHGNVKWMPEVIACYRVWDGGLTASRNASRQWMQEIELWGRRIAPIAQDQCRLIGREFSTGGFTDELVVRNLLSGYSSLRRRKASAAEYRELSGSRWPSQAPMGLQIKLLLHRILALLRS